jgi:hypothetical protein
MEKSFVPESSILPVLRPGRGAYASSIIGGG